MTRIVISSLSLCLLLIGCTEDEQTSTKENSETANLGATKSDIRVLFPLTESLTTASSITIRGTASSDITSLNINGIKAEFNTYDGFWVTDIPLEVGYNDVEISYSDSNGSATISSNRIRRSSHFYYNPTFFSYADIANKVFIYETRAKSFIELDLATESTKLVRQIRVSNLPDDARDSDELNEQAPEALAASSDGSKLYYLTEFSSNYYINMVETTTGQVSEFFGPSSSDYSSALFDNNGPLIFDQTNNQLILTTLDVTDSVSAINLNSKTVASLNAADLTATVAGAQFLHWAQKDSTTLVFLAKSGSSYFTGNVSIATGAYTNISTPQSLVSGCSAPSSSEGFTYQTTDNYYYWGEDDQLCYIDTASSAMINASDSLQGIPDGSTSFSAIFSVGDNIYAKSGSDSDFRLVEFNSRDDKRFVSEFLNVGDNYINPITAREVLLSMETNKAYYIIRDGAGSIDSQIFELNLINNRWKEVGRYNDVRFENAIINTNENAIYALNDSLSDDDELYRIDLSTGNATLVVGSVEKSTVPYSNFNVDSIAFDPTNQTIYLARQIKESLPSSDYGDFSLLAWSIEQQQLLEVVPISDQLDAKDIQANYDMVYSPAQESVYLYSAQESNNPIWQINVNTSNRSIISSDIIGSGPDTSNARGLAMDTVNNLIYVSSQDSQSVFKIDPSTGNRTMVSPGDQTLGTIFIQPKGIAVDGSSKVALIADESLEGIYQADLLTGQRVLIQN